MDLHLLTKYLGPGKLQTLLTNEGYKFAIHSFKPDEDDFKLLCTDGLRHYAQPVTERSAAYQHIELYMMLPDYWDLDKIDWPLQWLHRIAQVPQKNNTWFGLGDTLPAGSPPSPVHPMCDFRYFILNNPDRFAQQILPKMWDEEFSLLAVVPIFKREFDFKEQNGASFLFDAFQRKGITEMIDTFRQPAARRKFMGLF